MEFYPIYWINESKHAIRYTYSKYACTRLSRTKQDTIWTKHQLNQEGTHKCDKRKNCPNYIKNPNQHKIERTKMPNESKIPIDEHIIKE